MWNLRECVTTSSMSPAHEGPVNCLAANSDGSLVMTGSEDSTARLVSTTTGKVRARVFGTVAKRESFGAEGFVKLNN